MVFQLNQIPSEAKIKKELRRIIWRKNIACPRCKTREIKASEKRYWCKRCRIHFSILSNTYLSYLKLSLRTLWAILWCFCNRIPVKQAMSLTNLSEEAVRRAYDLFRSRIPEQYPILRDQVQLDEAFFFGRDGRSLILAKQVGTRELAYSVHSTTSLNRTHATDFLFQSVEPQTILQTDGAAIYRRIDEWWPVKHRTDIHSRWEFELTSEIEGMFGNLRTFIRRMYHHVTKDRFEGYVKEFCARFSSPELFFSPVYFLEKTLRSVPFD